MKDKKVIEDVRKNIVDLFKLVIKDEIIYEKFRKMVEVENINEDKIAKAVDRAFRNKCEFDPFEKVYKLPMTVDEEKIYKCQGCSTDIKKGNIEITHWRINTSCKRKHINILQELAPTIRKIRFERKRF